MWTDIRYPVKYLAGYPVASQLLAGYRIQYLARYLADRILSMRHHNRISGVHISVKLQCPARYLADRILSMRLSTKTGYPVSIYL